MDAPRTDRTDLLKATRTQLSQIFLLYADPDAVVARAVEAVAAHPAERWAVDDAGTEARLWRITDASAIASLTDGLAGRTLWIADGHHRYEASRAFRDSMRAQDGSKPGSRSYDYVMACLTSMDSAGVTILPYHRAIGDHKELDRAALTKKVREFFDVKEFSFEGFDPRAEQIRRRLREGARSGRNTYAAYTGPGSFLLLLVKEGLDRKKHLGDALAEPLHHLDVSVLHHLLFEKALGISIEHQRREGGPLHYTDDIDRALAWVDAGEAQVALLLNPTAKEHLMSVAAAGLQMPQKSTFFYPKVLTGLVLNPLEPVEEVQTVAASAAHSG
jgi:uncharacterized protein (DUF1015 family)